MTKRAYMLIGALVLTTMVAFSTAQAQSANQKLIANIPFEFSAGNQTLPAGHYQVTVVNPASDQKVLRLRGSNGRTVMIQMHSVDGKARNSGRLVFHRYGDTFFLAQAWTPADTIGMEAPRSKTERANQLARAERTIETVSLSAKAN
jgi:hypothetical protein